jgi:hypothetical protein
VLDEVGKPKPVEVRVGISDGQFVEIKDGLAEGAVIITGTEIPGAREAARAAPWHVALGAIPSIPSFQRRAALTAAVAESLIRIVDLKRSYALGT